MYSNLTFYQQAIRVWLGEHPGKIFTVHEIVVLFVEAYLKAATMETSNSGFGKTGIYPIQRLFNANSVAAAETTNREATAGIS